MSIFAQTALACLGVNTSRLVFTVIVHNSIHKITIQIKYISSWFLILTRTQSKINLTLGHQLHHHIQFPTANHPLKTEINLKNYYIAFNCQFIAHHPFKSERKKTHMFSPTLTDQSIWGLYSVHSTILSAGFTTNLTTPSFVHRFHHDLDHSFICPKVSPRS